MQPCLLLILALLGLVSASHPGSAPHHSQEVPADAAKEGRKFIYKVVNKYRSYSNAQWHCQNVLRGQLASVHSAARNTELKKLARTYTYSPVWIGAFTSRREGQWGSQWEDASPWNYANWAPNHPHHILTTCTTLSPQDGLWRSKPCFLRRPFICQY
ncbi:bone marrow proteoglycan-like [Athene noctua]|uniref:bone marrow proteoglycan-like n=1 Tax=Athene noctua TaxID=126797 RepID=UPI003EC0DAE9